MEKFIKKTGQDPYINPNVANDRVQAQFGHLNAIVDELNKIVPYKVYTALLTQTGTDAPVATVLENTLGGTVVWSYLGIGFYSANLSNAFTEDKTWCIGGAQNPISANNDVKIGRSTDNVVELVALEGDDALVVCCIEIRVYP
jgi:hypothetical protein